MHIKLLNWMIEHSVFYPGKKDNLSIRLILFEVSNKHTHQSECYLLATRGKNIISKSRRKSELKTNLLSVFASAQNLRNTMPQLFFYFYYF